MKLPLTINITNDTVLVNKYSNHQKTLEKIVAQIVLYIYRNEIKRLKVEFSKQKVQKIIDSYRGKYNFDKRINRYINNYKKQCSLIYDCLKKMEQEGLSSKQTYDKYLKNNSLKISFSKWQLFCNTYLSQDGLKRLKKIIETPENDTKQKMLMNSVIMPQYLYVLNHKIAEINQPSDVDVTNYLHTHTLAADIDKLPLENQKDFCKIMLHKAMIGKWWQGLYC